MRLPDPAEQPVLTVEETAAVLRVDRKTVCKAIAAGELPSLRLGRVVRIPTSALRRRLDPQRDDGAPDRAPVATNLDPSRSGEDLDGHDTPRLS